MQPNQGSEKTLYWHRFYNETSQLSLCKWSKPVSKSVQPLLMNWAFQTNKAWHSLPLLQERRRCQEHISNNLITLFLFHLSICVCGSPALWAQVMCDKTSSPCLHKTSMDIKVTSLCRLHSSPGEHLHVDLLVKWLSSLRLYWATHLPN